MIYLLLLLASAPLAAQFGGLATNDDGSILYFGSGPRFSGTDQGPYGKIFRWDFERGFELAARQERVNDDGFGRSRDYYNLSQPEVSGDGSVWKYRGARDCFSTLDCRSVNWNSTIKRPNVEDLVLDGEAHLSRNARYAIYDRQQFTDTSQQYGTAARLDLDSGVWEELGHLYRPDGQTFQFRSGSVIASNGTAVLFGPIVMTVTKEGIVTTLKQHASVAVIDDAGSVVVMAEDYGAVRIWEPQTGSQWILQQKQSRIRNVAISRDGQTILGLWGDELLVIYSRDGSVRNELAIGVEDAALSGNGNVVFAVMRWGAILRFDLATGEVRMVHSHYPQIRATEPYSVRPGEMITLIGTGLALVTDSASEPLPYELAGVSVRVGDVPARIRLVSPDRFEIRIPESLTISQASSLRVKNRLGSGFRF